jgi:hypothetical protein
MKRDELMTYALWAAALLGGYLLYRGSQASAAALPSANAAGSTAPLGVTGNVWD